MTFKESLAVAREHTTHQSSQLAGSIQEVLDSVTEEGIADLIYSDRRPLDDVGLVGAIFPRDYGSNMRNQNRSITVPFFHQTEFLVKAMSSATVEGEFRFLQVRYRSVQHYKQDIRGRMRWHPPTSVAWMSGKEYRSGPDAPVVHTVPFGPYKLSRLLQATESGGAISIPFNLPDGAEDPETIEDTKAKEKVKVTIGWAALKIKVEVSATMVRPGFFRLRVSVVNETRSETLDARYPFRPTEAVKRALFAGRTLTKVSGGGEIVPPNPRDEKIALGNQKRTQLSANVNTYPTLSKIEPRLIYSSPLIVSDHHRQEAISMDVNLVQLTQSQSSVFNNLYLLDDMERAYVKANWLPRLHAVLQALAETNPGRIERLYKFQWDAIQYFLKGLIHGDSRPFVLKAPTGSGKSLVFYVDAALMCILPDGTNGTTSFLSFPTRALNSQQFSEMIGFFYHLGKHGLSTTLGLYMGRDDDSDRQAAVKSLSPWNTREGDPIGIIEKCPNCGAGDMIAKKPSERRIVPVCSSCGTELSYLYLSNDETQRFCPNVVVGTPDKLVNAISYNVYSHVMVGAPAKKCPKCGQFYPLCLKDQKGDSQECQACGTQLGQVARTHTSPRLVVFDEVHTLTGTQGNLLAHFLALLRVLSKKYTGFDKHWYVGGSATVANPEKLVTELTGSTQQTLFPDDESFERDYFAKKTDSLRHRFVVFEPVRRTTRGSVSWLSLGIYDYLQREVSPSGSLAAKLSLVGVKPTDLKVQAVYVLRKNEGRDLDSYIPALASGLRMGIPETKFGSGDMTEMELAALARRVRASELDILLVTAIYGVGVDFPNLNIIHLFGTPRSFIELSQVVGRTGREKLPGLVFLHILPPVPRDQWVYQNFRYAVEDMQGLLEPTPINAMNRYAISVSTPNVFNALVMARAYEDHQMRYASHVASEFLADKTKLASLLQEMAQVYTRPASDSELPKVKNLIFNTVRQILIDFRTSSLETTKHLEQQQLLVPTLRGKSKLVYYSEAQSYPVLDEIEFTRDISRAALDHPGDPGQ